MSTLPDKFTPDSILGQDGLLAARMPGYEVRGQQITMADSILAAFLDKKHLVVEAGTGVGKSYAYLVPAILATSQDFLLPVNLKMRPEDVTDKTPKRNQRPYRRVIIATHTISLQEQLIQKDLPFLNGLLPLEFSFVLVKGRSNYFCWRRFYNAHQHAYSLFSSMEEMEALEHLHAWAKTTKDGTLSDMEARPLPRVWEETCCEQGNCAGKGCQYYQKCFYQAARRRIHNAQILVVNHALFFSDLGVRSQGGAILPEYDVVVFDEAHTVEAVAGDHLGIQITNGQVEYLLRRLYNERTGRGVLPQYELMQAIKLTRRCYEAADEFFSEIEQWYEAAMRESKPKWRPEEPPVSRFAENDEFSDDADEMPFPRASGTVNTPGVSGNPTKKAGFYGALRVRRPIDVPNTLSFALSQLAGCVRNDAAALENAEERLELDSLVERLKNLAANLDTWLKQAAKDFVYWMEYTPPNFTRGRRRNARYELCASPIDVGPVLREHLYNETASVIMTSATLATGRSGTARRPVRPIMPQPPRALDELAQVVSSTDVYLPADPAFDYFRHRIGLTQARTEELGSPFDYARQARIVLPQNMPDPTTNGHEFERQLAERICRYVTMTDGHTFVLFTSYGLLNRVAAAITPFLTSQNLALLSQGEGTPRSRMIERFKQNPRSVLLGADSFWQGVDVPGDALRNVIITKLPFRVPDHPLTEARMDAIKARGGNPFMEFQVPDAVIRLKQGFGRLIRSKQDTGMVVIMDPRVETKFYGKMFLQALPDCEVIRD